MAPLSFTKLFSSRSSKRSNGSDRRSSLDSFESGESYVIWLPSMTSQQGSLSTALPAEPSVSSSSGRSSQPAEMLDDDNFAWGRPSRKQHKSRRARS